MSLSKPSTVTRQRSNQRSYVPKKFFNNLEYPSLVNYFRERKHARQIMIITHNPNLVVTTDSEQIIICKFDGARAPRVQYRSGPLENTSPSPDDGIREEVGHILEGGVDAFRIREHRYDLPE